LATFGIVSSAAKTAALKIREPSFMERCLEKRKSDGLNEVEPFID
jgi:hypothetical protein